MSDKVNLAVLINMHAILRNNPLHLIPAILLKHLKLPVSAIREAVLSCDHSILGEQHIRLMAAFAPDKREVRGGDNFTLSFIYGFTRTPIVFSEKRILTLL